jgi:hypothetical protein
MLSSFFKYACVSAPILLGLLDQGLLSYGLTFSVLAAAIASGMWVLHKHQTVFVRFDTQDLWDMQMDAMLYVLVVISTALCVLDTLIQTAWFFEYDNPPAKVTFHTISMIVIHSGFAAVALLLHILVGRLLGNHDFCELCRRPR